MNKAGFLFRALVTAALSMGSVIPASAQDDPLAAVFARLRDQDVRLARIGERLALANASLCTDLVPRTGLLLHDLSQYEQDARPAARSFFGFAAPIAVEDVIPASAAAAAGIQAGDSIASVDGEILEAGQADTGKSANTDRVIAAEAHIDRAGADGAITLGLIRQGQPLTIELRAPGGCRTRFELVERDGYDAAADGAIVQLSTKMLGEARDDDELAFVVGHELAHNILRHRARLKAAGVDRGMFESIGKDVGYIRRSEVEADMLGIALAANAGFDPAAAARFWRRFGPEHLNSILLARTHPRWSLRARLLDRETAAIMASPARPYVPAILAERDKPMSRDWQALVAGL